MNPLPNDITGYVIVGTILLLVIIFGGKEDK